MHGCPKFCTSCYSAPGSSPLRTRTFWFPEVTSHNGHSLSPSEGSFHDPCMGAEGEISIYFILGGAQISF